ncbi:MAG: HVA1 family protein [Caulobacteraceae bacterium]
MTKSRSETPHRGDAVTWNASGGRAHGTVVKKLTGRGHIRGTSSRRPRTIRNIW